MENIIDNMTKQLSDLHLEIFEMLTDCRNLQYLIMINKAPHLEIIDKIDITNDIIEL